MDDFESLSADAAEWAAATFPQRTVKSIAKHLEEEARELHENPDDLTELADCLLLVLDAASAAGLTPKRLLKITRNKLEVCKKRQWQEPDEHGVVRHVK